LSCFNILNIKYNLIINFELRNCNISTISKFNLFNLSLNKFLLKKVLQNFNFFNNLVSVFYIATSFKRIIVKKDFK